MPRCLTSNLINNHTIATNQWTIKIIDLTAYQNSYTYFFRNYSPFVYGNKIYFYG